MSDPTGSDPTVSDPTVSDPLVSDPLVSVVDDVDEVFELPESELLVH